MIKATKKPVTIEAVHLSKCNTAEVLAFVGKSAYEVADGVEIETPEGTMLASWGDYVIKGVQGEFYPCKPDVFVATYDLGEVRKPRLKGEWRIDQGVYSRKIGGVTITVTADKTGATVIETTGEVTDLIGNYVANGIKHWGATKFSIESTIQIINNFVQKIIDDLTQVIEF
jgi:hypothetical protein